MTSLLSGPVLPALNTRGSTHIGVSGLFVLGLGSLVLLTGLTTPNPTPNDVVMLGISTGADGLSLPQWLAAAGMIGVGLVIIGLRRRMQWLFVLLASGA